MPGDGVGALGQEFSSASVIGTSVHEVDLREALGCSRGLVDVVSAKVAAEYQGFLDGQVCKVLVAECCMVC